MTLISDKRYARTLDTLVDRILTLGDGTREVEAWLFDDLDDRRRAEGLLAAAGIKARLRSAYKPLVHYFLEELEGELQEVVAVSIGYPVVAEAIKDRFLLECYPLAGLFPGLRFSFAGQRQEVPIYQVTLTSASGQQRLHQVFAPNGQHLDQVDETHFSPTGWLKRIGQDGSLLENGPLVTDYQQLFTDTIAIIDAQPWRQSQPFFDELNITVTLPGGELPLSYGQETISRHEALHEDLYFSLLELFQRRAGRPLGDRGLQPGQIVPEVRSGDGPPRVIIATRSLSAEDIAGPHQDLETATAPLAPEQIAAELAKVGGKAFSATSRAGRLILAACHQGTDFPVMISGGQHANETSGVVGALRAAKILATRPQAHFTVAPLENPDGYALHQRLIRDNPSHMHHAARYTALGDDLGHRRGDLHEAAIRSQARQLSGAQLHLNLHGYPSHEWTRPLSGYLPRGFAMWTLPKGFFLILRHHLAWQERGERFLDQLTRRLAELPGLVDFNARQLEISGRHGGGAAWRLLHGFPCLLEPGDEGLVPLELISEYPDETCYNHHFVAAHDAQTATVLAAYEIFQQLMADENG